MDKTLNLKKNVETIVENIELAKQKAGRQDVVRVMAVTKTVNPERIRDVVGCGVDLLGENRVQEFLEKRADYPESAEVHFIGSLQTNKVRHIIDKVKMIQSVDSVKLANEIDRLAKFNNLEMNVLIQVNIGGELTKGGVAPDELDGFLSEIASLGNVKLRGLMTIPPVENVEKYFEKMQRLFEDLKLKHENIDTLSMGMSGDYEKAVMYGSTIVRVGSLLFGSR